MELVVRPYRPGQVRALVPPPPEFLMTKGLLHLEIGCGVGMHPLRYALKHHDRRLIAIEHTREKFAKFDRRWVQHQKPANLLPVNANAISWVHQFLGPGVLDRIFLLYPNPNPLNPAQRWLRMPFMGRLLDSLKVGGQVHLATNMSDYAREARDYAHSAWGLQILVDRQLRSQDFPVRVLTDGVSVPDLTGSRTHFERKYLQRGEACFDLVFQKVSDRQFYFGAATCRSNPAVSEGRNS